MIYSFQNTSFRDQQTGLYSEAYFMEIFYREWHRMMRERHALSLLVVHPNIDIVTAEGLKQYVSLANLLEQSIKRSTDIVSRFQNNEFIIGLFDLNHKGTSTVLKRIVSMAQQHSNGGPSRLNSAFIAAVNVTPDHQIDINGLFEQAFSIPPTTAQNSAAKNEILFDLRDYTLNGEPA